MGFRSVKYESATEICDNITSLISELTCYCALPPQSLQTEAPCYIFTTTKKYSEVNDTPVQ